MWTEGPILAVLFLAGLLNILLDELLVLLVCYFFFFTSRVTSSHAYLQNVPFGDNILLLNITVVLYWFILQNLLHNVTTYIIVQLWWGKEHAHIPYTSLDDVFHHKAKWELNFSLHDFDFWDWSPELNVFLCVLLYLRPNRYRLKEPLTRHHM